MSDTGTATAGMMVARTASKETTHHVTSAMGCERPSSRAADSRISCWVDRERAVDRGRTAARARGHRADAVDVADDVGARLPVDHHHDGRICSSGLRFLRSSRSPRIPSATASLARRSDRRRSGAVARAAAVIGANPAGADAIASYRSAGSRWAAGASRARPPGRGRTVQAMGVELNAPAGRRPAAKTWPTPDTARGAAQDVTRV